MTLPPDERRRELDRLQAQVATRSSVLHFARGAISALLSLMVLGLAYGVWREGRARGNAPLAYLGMLLGACLVAYAVSRFWLGRRAYVREQALVRQLRSLRRELKLEDPSALLPQ